MPEVKIEDLDHNLTFPMRINGHNGNFVLKTEAIEAATLRDLDPVSEDLLEIAAAVFYADSELPRGGSVRSEMGQKWYRHIRLTVQVRDLDLWQRPDVTKALVDAVGFLTDDQVEFRFEARRGARNGAGFFNLDPKGASFAADEIILFSGGLDSFSGALDVLATTNRKVLLVSHRSATKVIFRQDQLAGWLIKRFPDRVRHIKVQANRHGPESRETTQRSRSFLFAAIGYAVARSFGSEKISFYENGIVSANLPIGPQVTATMATRTTHPLALLKLNHLLCLIDPHAAKISNGFEWMTKAEVVERLRRHNGTSMIPHAVSCTHVRDQTKLHTHCGQCSQCLDRRFAIMAAGLAEFDPETRYAKDVLIGPHNPDLGKTLAVEWSRQAVRIEAEGEVAFISRFAAELSRLCLGHPELGSQAALAAVLDLHRRQAWSVAQALKDAIASNLDGIALHRIPPTSLLMMHIGDQPTMQSDLAEPPSAGLPATQARGDWEESDQIVSPDGPWTVIFRVEAGRPSVDIVGLDTISGPPAQIAHLLKVVFQQDLERGLPFSEHQYVLIYQLPGVAIGKTLAAQHVSRFRKSAAVAYERLFHHPPAEPLLIESSGRKGHRLDPRTRVIDRN